MRTGPRIAATGRYAHQTGYWDNALAYDGQVKGWGHALHDAGVQVTSIGKLHFRNDSDPTGFDEQIVPMHIMDGVGQIWGSVRNPLPDIQKRPKFLETVGAGMSKYNKYDMLIAVKNGLAPANQMTTPGSYSPVLWHPISR